MCERQWGWGGALLSVAVWHHVFIRRGNGFISVSVSQGKRYCGSGSRRQIMAVAAPRDKHGQPKHHKKSHGTDGQDHQTSSRTRQTVRVSYSSRIQKIANLVPLFLNYFLHYGYILKKYIVKCLICCSTLQKILYICWVYIFHIKDGYSKSPKI